MSVNEEITVLLCGDGGIGKSSLLRLLTNEQFNPEHDMTYGVEFRKLEIDRYQFKIYDTAGQKQLHKINHRFFNEVDVFLQCFDLSNEASFDNLATYDESIEQYGSKNATVALIGTKLDLKDARQVDDLQIDERCKLKHVPHYLISSKTQENLDELRQFLATQAEQTLQQRAEKEQQFSATKAVAKLFAAPTHDAPRSPLVLGLFCGVSGLTGAGLIATCIAVAVVVSSAWPVALGILGLAALGAAGFFAYRSYQSMQVLDDNHHFKLD